MWLTGFDAPNCSTLYLDKPMRGGATVSFPDNENGGQRTEVVSLVDWLEPEKCDFLLASAIVGGG